MGLRKYLTILLFLLEGGNIYAQDLDSVYTELLCLLNKKPIDWMESIENLQRQTLLLGKLGRKKDVSFIGYLYKGVIDTDEQVEVVRKALISDSTFVTVWESDGTFRVATVSEVRKKYPNRIVPYSCVLNVKKELQYVVQKGLVLLELWWRYEDKIYPSIAVVQKDGWTIFDTIGYFMPGISISTIISKTKENGKIKEKKEKKIIIY